MGHGGGDGAEAEPGKSFVLSFAVVDLHVEEEKGAG